MKIKQTQNIICIFNVSRETYVVKYEIQKSNQKMKKRIKKLKNTKRDMLFRKAKQHAKEKKRDEKTKGINRLLAACCFDSNRSLLGFSCNKERYHGKNPLKTLF